MAIIQGHAKGAAVAGFYPQTISQSLRFEDGDSAYLNKTLGSGDSTEWTWSAWVKRGNLSADALGVMFHAGLVSGTNVTSFRFLSTDKIRFYNQGAYFDTDAVFRDTSAWYHIVLAFDSDNATTTDRAKVYVNGVRQTGTWTGTSGSSYINTAVKHTLGYYDFAAWKFDGYMAEVHFTDGTAYTADDFGELKNDIWVPKADIATTLTYGTNGFYLPFAQDTAVEGFNTVTYNGNGTSGHTIEGVGFEPDLVWLKSRNNVGTHGLFDSVRGVSKDLQIGTGAEGTLSGVSSFNSDGFSLGTNWNQSGYTFVGWCWDAGSGSPVSNTDGSITSTVKANTDYGFSIASWTATTGTQTVGHGLNSTPEMVIMKNRSTTSNWAVFHTVTGSHKLSYLNLTNAAITPAETGPTSTVFTVAQTSATTGSSGNNMVAYCFHSVSGYSDFGTYTGNGLADDSGPVVTTGFKPALVIYKQSSGTGNWSMVDNTRSPEPVADNLLNPNLSNAENTSDEWIKFTDTGFQVRNTHSDQNANGATYIYMAFADKRDAAFWLDESGNNNDWTSVNLENSDVVPDSPTNNFGTMNALYRSYWGAGVLSEGNSKWYMNGDGVGTGTFFPSTGKWYFEVYKLAGSGNNSLFGIIEESNNGYLPNNKVYYRSTGGDITNFGTTVATGLPTLAASGDVVGVAYDLDTGDVEFFKNGVSLGSTTIASGNLGKGFGVYLGNGNSNSSDAKTFILNCGQDSTFAGNVTAGGNTDANGIGDFKYAPPSGYLALCTSNLPDPVIDPAQDVTPEDYFNTVLYTGNSTTGHAITGVGFQPDFVWIKSRSVVSQHVLTDVVRGTDKQLFSSLTNFEQTSTTGITSFDSDGFTLGTEVDPTGSTNNSGTTYVAWNWKSGGTGTSIAVGAYGTSPNVPSIASTVSANTDAGFSIVGYNGTQVPGDSVGHGLSQAPEMIMVKKRGGAVSNWAVYHHGLNGGVDPEDYSIDLNNTSAAVNTSADWNDQAPTSSVFYLGNGTDSNDGGSGGIAHIAYCFHSVDGFSKVGSYKGNGSTDGTFVYTGFRPKWVMLKDASGGQADDHWNIVDVERNTYNIATKYLDADQSNAEMTYSPFLDIVSNGFKCRNTGGGMNTSGNTYIYLAFAEQPFKYSNAR